MKRAEWTLTALNVGLPYTSIPAYTLAPLVLAAITPSAIPYYITWPVAFVLCVWLLYLNVKKKRTPAWVLRRIYSWLRNGVYHSRPIWHVRRMSRSTSPDVALKISLRFLEEEAHAFGFDSGSQSEPAGRVPKHHKAAQHNQNRTDQSKRKNSQ